MWRGRMRGQVLSDCLAYVQPVDHCCDTALSYTCRDHFHTDCRLYACMAISMFVQTADYLHARSAAYPAEVGEPSCKPSNNEHSCSSRLVGAPLPQARLKALVLGVQVH